MAAKRIKGHVRMTPSQTSKRLNAITGANVFMKMENTQHTGAYKERGALNKLLSLSDDEKNAGVFAASAGNHAQGHLNSFEHQSKFSLQLRLIIGLAYHAGRLNVKSTIFMPLGTPVIKVTRTKFYGATVELVGNSFDDAYAACMAHLSTHGGTLVHPFDDFDIIAGQGTIGLEIMDQIPDVDVIVVPIGGSSLHLTPRLIITFDSTRSRLPQAAA